MSFVEGITHEGCNEVWEERFIGPSEFLRRVDPVAYELDLPPGISAAHPVFLVSMLKRYHPDDSHVIQWDSMSLDKNLTFDEESIVILDRRVRNLRSKDIASVKVETVEVEEGALHHRDKEESLPKQLLERMKLSINYLPEKVREYFLDLGAFLEDKRIPLDVLINMWVELHDIVRGKAFHILVDLSDKNLLNLVKVACVGDKYTSYYEISVSQYNVLRDLAIHMSNRDKVTQRRRLVMPRRDTRLPKEWETNVDDPFHVRVISVHTEKNKKGKSIQIHVKIKLDCNTDTADENKLLLPVPPEVVPIHEFINCYVVPPKQKQERTFDQKASLQRLSTSESNYSKQFERQTSLQRLSSWGSTSYAGILFSGTIVDGNWTSTRVKITQTSTIREEVEEEVVVQEAEVERL
ncbi:putative disease resistance protein [Capsicum chinense]|nr:putative disease resistance protein [Capsicum chinense]